MNIESREVIHVVALSGGKDSTALAIRLKEVEPRPYKYVCTPTGRELPEMIQHWDRLEKILDAPLIRIMRPGGLDGLIEMFGSLPNNRQRWCTRMAKIEPYQKWIAEHTPAISYVGLRADEDRLGVVYDDQSGITQDYPLKRWGWGLSDVQKYLISKNIKIPRRTDCDICYDQQLEEWYNLWRDHPAQWGEGENYEEKTGHTFRSPSRDSWPAAMKELRAEFEKGRLPRSVLKKLAKKQQGTLFGKSDGEPEEYERCRVCRM